MVLGPLDLLSGCSWDMLCFLEVLLECSWGVLGALGVLLVLSKRAGKHIFGGLGLSWGLLGRGCELPVLF